jgi:hypothetical protein
MRISVRIVNVQDSTIAKYVRQVENPTGAHFTAGAMDTFSAGKDYKAIQSSVNSKLQLHNNSTARISVLEFYYFSCESFLCFRAGLLVLLEAGEQIT